MPSKVKLSRSLPSRKNPLAEKLARALADYDNLEKRVVSQRREWALLAKVEIVDKFLPVLDDLLRAQDHLKNKGLSMVVNQFQSVFKSEGVAEVPADPGVKFNPETMDCVGLDVGPKNRVIKLVERGYFLSEKIIRPAKVVVGSGKNRL